MAAKPSECDSSTLKWMNGHGSESVSSDDSKMRFLYILISLDSGAYWVLKV